MTTHKIVKMGSKQLATPSIEVVRPTEITQSMLDLLRDMRETMELEGGIGIAAPQIGINVRVMIFGFEHSARYPIENAVPYTVLINPTLKMLTEEMVDGWEGCLSVPNLRGLVPRYRKLAYQGYNHEGEFVSGIAEDFHARVIQHEYDHLDGILYPQRIKDMRYFGFEDALLGR